MAGNAGESDIRRVGRTLEEFRSAIATLFPKVDQTSAVPTTILVFKNDESFKPYKPLYKGQPSNALAFFQPGPDANYIAVTAGLPSPNIVLHEYMHFLLRENVGALPTWLSEGLAECYSTFEPGGRQNEFTLGRAPETHIATLSMPQPFIPFKRLFEVQDGSPEYNEASKQGMFYAESWAAVHYFLFGPDPKRQKQFNQFLNALAKGDPFDASFADAFQTDYGTIQEEVRDYIRKRTSWPTIKVTTKEPLPTDNRSASAAVLSDGETEYYLGDLLLHMNRLPEAETHLTAAVAKSPDLAMAQASLGLLRVRQKKYDDATALLKKTYESDSKNPMVAFYYAYVMERADAEAGALTSTDRLDVMRTSAKKAIELSPRFVEAHALLARVDLNAGEHLDEAEATLKQALSIAPGREDFQMLLAQTELRSGRRADARVILERILRSATDADMRRRATAMLDQSEQVIGLTEITDTIEKEIKNQPKPVQPAPVAATAPAPSPAPSRRAQETVLEPLTPISPNVDGEKLTGLLVNLDCSNGLTLRIRTDRNTVELHSSNPDKIQFLSYTADVGTNVQCGPRNPGTPVNVTYRPVPNGVGEPLVIEFTQK
ncbi:MAG TPA: tetratricopeptide repeat protein [Terriglobia bacterium]|nr:tetratricopeptide repeat protein [Terriglobia bacterium]